MRASTPALTSFLGRSARMWRVMPSRASNASNRRTRKKQSRRISSVQRSPITDTVRATEHGSRLSWFQRMSLPRARFPFDNAPHPDARCQGSFLERMGGTMQRVVGEWAGVPGDGGDDPARGPARIAGEAVNRKLKPNPGGGVKRGVLGAPTFFAEGEMFFGQDRLDFVEDALLGRSYLSASEAVS